MSGSEAGTKYRAFLRSAATAGQELGLSFVDANKQLISLPEILDTLRDKYGATIDAIEKQQLQKAFGSDEAVALIDLMYAKTRSLKDSVVHLYDVMGQGTAVTREMADAINSVDSANWARLQQRLQNVKEQLGGALLPAVDNLMAKADPLIDKVSTFVAQNQALTGGIMLTVLAFGALLTVAGVLALSIGAVGFAVTQFMLFGAKLGAGLKILKGGFETLQIAALYAGGAIKAFAVKGLAFLASPAGMAVVAIAAVIAVLYLLYKNWDFVKEKAAAAWTTVSTAVSNAAAAVKSTVGGLVDGIKDKGTELAAFVTALPGRIGAGIKSGAGKIYQAVADSLAQVEELLPFSDAKTGPLAHLTYNGQQIMRTIGAGVAQAEDEPARAVRQALAKPEFNLPDDLAGQGRRIGAELESRQAAGRDGGGRTVKIGKLYLNFDLSTMEELPKLRRALEDLADLTDGEDDYLPEPA
jgi:hypothetical protein